MIVDVALPIPVARAFSYYVPPEWQPHIKPLSRVIVPFRTRVLAGFVTGIREGEKGALKEIAEPADLFPLVDGSLALLADWASEYYVTPPGLVLKSVLPAPRDIEKYLVADFDDLTGVPLKKALHSLGKDEVLSLYGAGLLTVRDTFGGSPFTAAPVSTPKGAGDKTLYIGSARHRLAHYTSLISDRLARGENVLMLLPDYHGAGSYFYRAFLEAFPGRALWYGAPMKAKARMETYFRTRTRGGFLILGNRSCVFLPARDLGLVIVDRHEEDYYRNEEDFRFNAVAVAVKRAEIEGIPAVLGTTSPSMEVFKQVEDGGFRLIKDRWPRKIGCGEAILEKNIASYDGLPDGLLDIMRPALENNERIALYTPRKDYSSAIQCTECKTLFTCPVCGGGVSYQKSRDTLSCPGCAKKFPYDETCPQCGSGLIRFFHVGAEYFEEQVKLAFPHVHVVRITGETTKKEKDALRKTPEGSPLVVIGTQTLGSIYDVPVETLILVGWEQLARLSGFRAHEKMFHILMHLLDALDPGQLYFCMEKKRRIDSAPFLDVMEFCRAELVRRKVADFPPFTRFFLVQVEKKAEAAGLKTVARVREILEQAGLGGSITGPLFQKKENYQWRMILNGSGDALYHALLGLYDIPDVRIEAEPLYL